jgi:hypothetical protein
MNEKSIAEADPKPENGGAYDYRGRVHPQYAPENDGDPDAGEIVWAWVPYEDDPTLGKDRPIVLVGLALDAPGDFVAFMLTSHKRDGYPGWVAIGAGAWDDEHRESWVRVDRALGIAPDAVRREGAALTEEQFNAIVTEARNAFTPSSTHSQNMKESTT